MGIVSHIDAPAVLFCVWVHPAAPVLLCLRIAQFPPQLTLPEDLIPMAYGYLDSVYATGPLDIAAHTRTRALPRPPDLMGIRGARRAAAPELIAARRCHSIRGAAISTQQTAAQDTTQRPAMGSALHLAPNGLSRAVKGICTQFPPARSCSRIQRPGSQNRS